MTKATRGETSFTVGTGNVFRDLGLDFPEEELSKARLALQIHDRVQALGLNVTKAAIRLGIPQPKASRLLRGWPKWLSVMPAGSRTVRFQSATNGSPVAATAQAAPTCWVHPP